MKFDTFMFTYGNIGMEIYKVSTSALVMCEIVSHC